MLVRCVALQFRVSHGDSGRREALRATGLASLSSARQRGQAEFRRGPQSWSPGSPLHTPRVAHHKLAEATHVQSTTRQCHFRYRHSSPTRSARCSWPGEPPSPGTYQSRRRVQSSAIASPCIEAIYQRTRSKKSPRRRSAQPKLYEIRAARTWWEYWARRRGALH